MFFQDKKVDKLKKRGALKMIRFWIRIMWDPYLSIHVNVLFCLLSMVVTVAGQKIRDYPAISGSVNISEMGKIPVKMRAVVYSLSPYQQKIMPGLWKDFTSKIHHKVTENWISASLLLTPLVGTYSYVQWYQEKEKLEHRY